jgi:hypothetical protein
MKNKVQRNCDKEILRALQEHKRKRESQKYRESIEENLAESALYSKDRDLMMNASRLHDL